MKKLFLALGFCVAISFTQAQNLKPQAMDFTAESQTDFLQIVDNLNVSAGRSPLLSLQPRLKARMFLNDKMAVRLGIGMCNFREKESYQYTNAAGIKYTGIERNTTTFFTITPGFEYHFGNFNRVAPYLGCEIGPIMGSQRYFEDNTLNSDYYKEKTPFVGLYAALFTGVDVYITDGFYLGFEIGFGGNWVKYKDDKWEDLTDGIKTEGKANKENYETNRTIMVTPGFKIGWRF